jgi:two-component system LytT family sensor kinase
LGSTLVIPLRGEDNRVIGTIKLYEPKRKLFSSLNRTLGEGMARLLSTQILAGKYSAQSELLAQSEIKLLHAQVNPHFLFNALNTLGSVIRRDPEHARQLVQHLSLFFRKNLRRGTEEVTLKEELEHVNSYLQIELARFPDRLKVLFQVDDLLLNQKLPAFSLQPIVENAIKHGISQTINGGTVTISGQRKNDGWQLVVADDAGLFDAPAAPDKDESSNGLGMNLVEKYGESYGANVESMVGCGPFKMTSWKRNSKIELEKNLKEKEDKRIEEEKIEREKNESKNISFGGV